MYIISKFHDYYDGIVHQVGIDKKCIYERHTTEVKTTLFNQTHLPSFENADKSIQWKIPLVGFCGRVIPVLHTKIEKYTPGKSPNQYSTEENNYYGKKEILKEVEKRLRKLYTPTKTNKVAKYALKFKDVNTYKFYSGKDKRGNSIHTLLKDWLESFENRKFDELFHQYKTPIFLYEGENKLTLNPELYKYQFFKLYDPFTTFNELSMYILGTLGTNENKMIVTSDKDRLISKGFDVKTSFRNLEPPARKVKKQNEKMFPKNT